MYMFAAIDEFYLYASFFIWYIGLAKKFCVTEEPITARVIGTSLQSWIFMRKSAEQGNLLKHYVDLGCAST